MPDEIMVSIWKMPIAIKDRFTLQLPLSAKILTVQSQNGIPCIWISFPNVKDKEIQTEPKNFAILPTGTNLVSWGEYQQLKYIGTFMSVNDTFVGHLYEII